MKYRARFRTPRVVAAAVAAHMLGGGAGLGETGQSSGWREATSPHFIIVTDASDDDAREIALQLERVRSAFQTMTQAIVDPPEPPVIFAARRQRSLDKFLRDFDRTGVFIRTPLRSFMLFVGKERGPNPYGTLYHEYTHLLTSLNLRRVPLWLNEGLATFFSFSLIKGDDLERAVRPYREHLARESTIPLALFFSVDHTSPYYREGDKVAHFYAQAWALTHLILVGDTSGQLRSTLNDYLTLLGAYVPAEVAYRRTFGRVEELEPMLYNDVRKRFYYSSLEPAVRLEADAIVVRELSTAEWAALRGDFLFHTGRPDEARPLLQDAVSENRELALAHETLGALAFRDGDMEAARAGVEQAIALGSAGYSAHYYLGLVLEREGKLTEAERAIAKSIEVNPRFGLGFAKLAEIYEAVPNRLDEAVAMAYMAAEFQPESTNAMIELARLRRNAGEPAEATKSAARAVAVAVDAENANLANSVCWYGSLAGFAEVVLPACERAVTLGPDDAGSRDSRGLARALMGDLAGAIEDFRFYVDSDPEARSERNRAQRLTWIEALEAGDSPFDDATLDALRRGSTDDAATAN